MAVLADLAVWVLWAAAMLLALGALFGAGLLVVVVRDRLRSRAARSRALARADALWDAVRVPPADRTPPEGLQRSRTETDTPGP